MSMVETVVELNHESEVAAGITQDRLIAEMISVSGLNGRRKHLDQADQKPPDMLSDRRAETLAVSSTADPSGISASVGYRRALEPLPAGERLRERSFGGRYWLIRTDADALAS